MKGIEYAIGIGESLGYILITYIPFASSSPILIIISLALCAKDKPWEIPSSLFTMNSVT
jgi:hypothetical protein